jgi:rhamnulokinase
MLGTLAQGKLIMEELHRFPNRPIRLGNSLRWDLLGLFREIKVGLTMLCGRDIHISGLSVDSWGVDYVWSGAGQVVLSLPYTYRDARIDAAMAEALAKTPAATVYGETGMQFMPFNTVFQLFADHRDSPALVGISDHFLPIADFINFLLSGVARCEESLASTTQIYDPRSRQWSNRLIEEFGFRREVFPEIVPSGTVLGPLLPAVSEETGLESLPVIAGCSHDTGAAVAAVPAAVGEDWAYLSSGTWSLLGVELSAPLITEEARKANFTNEGGVGGSTRFLTNVVGLWILQECRRTWERAGQNYSYAHITNLAVEADPLRSLIHPDDPRFLKPGQMPEKVAAFCRETGQPIPESPGQIARCILESLALIYRKHLEVLEILTGRHLRKLHIVGGGSQSVLLNQFAANATGRTVLAGPTEATAIGNLLIQALAVGALDSLDALRATVRASFSPEVFTPEDTAQWDAAFTRFCTLLPE